MTSGSGSEPARAARATRKRATSREIASAAAVSQATVSNVLNRPELVSPDTSARVRAAMDALGFVINESARTLRAGYSRTIGAIVLDVSNPFWGEVTRGIEAGADELGYSVVLSSSEESLDKEQRYVRLFEQQRVSAVLVATVDACAPLFGEIHERGTDVVFLDSVDALGRFSSVSVDHVSGAGLVGEHLIAKGHRRIAFVNGPLTVPWCRDRSIGLRAGVRASGCDPDAVVIEITIGSMTTRDGEPAVAQLLRDAPDATAVFCTNDMVAMGVLKELTHRGIRVPADLSLVGYDDDYFAELLSPALTTIRQPPYEFGRLSAQLAVGPDCAPGRQVVLHPELVERDSVRRIT